MSNNPNHSQCLVCSSTQLSELKGYEKDYLTKCKSCGLVFCQAIPSTEELEAYYSSYGYDQEPFISPLTRDRYNELLDQFEPFRKTNRILDVGCGLGYFLEEAQKRGWEVYGTEYSPVAIEKCEGKGFQMKAGILNAANYDSGYFDVVTSFEVIEHINNPQEELTHIKGILRPGGAFYCTTPNFNSIERLHLKGKYNIIKYPEHLTYYTRKTLRKVVKEKGFETASIRTTGFSLTRIKTSKGNSQKLISATSDDERIRAQISSSKLLSIVKIVINRGLSTFGIGTSLKGMFIKKP